MTSLTYPDGEVARSSYNAQGGLETVGLGATPIVTGARYNAAGQLTQLAYGNGVVTDYSYNPQTLRLSSLRTTNTEHRTMQDFSYTFDAVGNVTAITDRVHTGSQSFTYDGLHRLTRAVGSYGDHRYAYDPLGNLTEKEGRSLLYGTGPAGPHAVSSTSEGLTLTYDANGNVTEKRPSTCPPSPVSCPGAQTFKYDAENRLVEVTSPQRQTVTLTLQPGWNLVSLPVTPDDAAISAIFPSFAQDLTQISRVTEHRTLNTEPTFEHYVGHPKFDQFSTLEAGVAYEVYATRTVTLTLSGSVPATASRALAAGWHLLPALVDQAMSPAAAFAGLALGSQGG